LTDEVLGKGKGKDSHQQLIVVDPHLGWFDRKCDGPLANFVTAHNSASISKKLSINVKSFTTEPPNFGVVYGVSWLRY